MLTVPAYAATSATEPLTPTTVERRDLGPHDVLMEIKYVGICHSDIHNARSEWGPASYPMVPGHEIAGVVAEVGSEVTGYAPGDRAGVGCMVNSCRVCELCLRGEEQYCLNGNTLTYGSVDEDGTLTQGGYSTHVVVNDDFVLRLPETLTLDEAAPLLCAGITTYSPLRRWGAGPGKKAAVVGLGGLGHLAVKIGHALGAEVTVLSQSLKKMDDGLRLGAREYFATSDPATFEQLAGAFDLIVNTVSARIDLDAHLGLLKPGGAFINLGAPPEALSLNAFSLVMHGHICAGSLIGGIRETQEMLDFCGAHGVGAEVEIIPAAKINEAFERMLASDVRYRFVIDTSTLA
ncbi:NAD(P)-dependent alcohol dehydrogenase [Streptomyces sp. BK340]|uniref:NAD(P)-dependent alcohol dehydrogenase n=1 Tax=Streptomyces sp. BK340 TaxID=2572903 RepID=UPI00119DCA5B|nr:NAD(P)-dependent alcohol dehydrogenase [Streptomyces sp. BK340]TVZ99514.1 putative zinc-type alcohol dehydrogenase-like protein [Streptomyces sp. BK340]